jgi:anti-sigma factor RsiW
MTGLHVTSGQLIRALDGELTPLETSAVERHLDTCDDCRLKLREFGALSAKIDAALVSTERLAEEKAEYVVALRDGLSAELLDRERENASRRSHFRHPAIAGALAAGALAAGLALALFKPAHTPANIGKAAATVAASSGTFQINGETFTMLPYSNSALSAVAPRIVEMQVPAADLAQAGIVFEPISMGATYPDRSVRADVLFGADGEPLGVHVLTQD